MLKLLFVTILFYSVFFSFGMELNYSPSGNMNNLNCPEALQRFTDSLLTYSAKLTKSYAESTTAPYGTGAFSPLAMFVNVAILALFAEGNTKTELYSVLNVKTRDEIICICNNIYNDAINLPDCITYRASYFLFGDKKYNFTEKLKKVQKKVIRGIAKNLDFSKPMDATDKMNAIVAATDNRIPTLYEDPSEFDSSTQLVMGSGIYFEGEWKIKFEKSNHLKEFRISPTKSLPQRFLYQGAEYLWAHSDILGAEVIQINFCCDSFILWEILPDCPFAEDTVIEKIAENTDWVKEVLKNFKLTKLYLHIPKYEKITKMTPKVMFNNATGIKFIYADEDGPLELKGAIVGDIPAKISLGRQATNLKVPYKGGPVPNDTQSGEGKIISADYPHIWMAFLNSRVAFVGIDRSPVDRQ